MAFLENWLGKADKAVSLAGYSTEDGSQHLFVAGPDGFVHPLEIEAASNWQWTWRKPIMSYHGGIAGLAAYYHPGDGKQHVFAALESGDIWESRFSSGEAPTENWLRKLDQGILGLAGYPTEDGSQHLFVAGPDGFVHPLEIGATSNWQWSLHEPIMSYHDGIVGLAAYYHPGDGQQHIFAILKSGDIWESRSWESQPRIENWLGKLDREGIGLAGYPTANGSQHLFVAGSDGLVHPLEIEAVSNWQWTWREPIMSYHDGIVGLAAYYHPGDGQQHVFAALQSGDIWESRFRPVTSFANDIRPLFRPMDVDAMLKTDYPIDLSSYQGVKDKADLIYAVLSHPTPALRMPCDGPWPNNWVATFKRWIDEGTLP